MVVERLRSVFDAWPGGAEPNALQLTSIKQGPHGEVLGNHYDHRDRWGNWIATVAWMRAMTEQQVVQEVGVGGMQEPGTGAVVASDDTGGGAGAASDGTGGGAGGGAGEHVRGRSAYAPVRRTSGLVRTR